MQSTRGAAGDVPFPAYRVQSGCASVRIAFFHNWSWLGAAVARALFERNADQLWVIGAPVPVAERDPELRERARRANAVLAAPKDIASPVFLKRLRVFAPDLILVATFARKFPPALLAVPKLAAINVHASLLPKYRGALPEFWVLRNGEVETGVSIHLMTAEFDAGNVLAQESLPVLGNDDLLTLSERISRVGAPLALQVVEAYRQGYCPKGQVQDETLSSRAPMPKGQHLNIIWTESSASIERLIRASTPMLDPSTTFRQTRLIVRAVRTMPEARRLEPGEVYYEAKNGTLLVGTADCPLSLEEVELGGGFRARGARFAKMYPMQPGEKLGD